MTFAYVIDKILTSSILLFFFYISLATLILCIAYMIEQEVQRIMAEKQEQRELWRRPKNSLDAVADDV